MHRVRVDDIPSASNKREVEVMRRIYPDESWTADDVAAWEADELKRDAAECDAAGDRREREREAEAL